MNSVAALAIPGAEGIAAAYADMLECNLAPLVARDWLIDQVRAIARDDILEQVERNYGTPAVATAAPATLEERTAREIDRVIKVAVAVYNRQRGRVTVIDHIATATGAAAINRVAAIRAARSGDTDRAVLVTPLHVDTIQVRSRDAAHYVCAMLRIGGRVRALSARLESKTYRHPTVRLTDFNVLMS